MCTVMLPEMMWLFHQPWCFAEMDRTYVTFRKLSFHESWGHPWPLGKLLEEALPLPLLS